ncbi:glycosyltransferase family 4 protein [Candidatus Borrarchaeum sp.]|uniref:glycosyltransferase family 4 protein n=1 Tax=Candidatus Borrarchaeum sp. TaxID=2846742 RepID=UPI00257B2215|nr:glycosyltransferase family 4 protein [Candidatus Borrarchaeum sp.]
MALRKILITCDNYYPVPGGIQQYVRGLGLELSKQGYKINILTSSVEGQRKREKMPEGHVIRTSLMNNAIWHPEIVLSKWKQLASLISSIKPDIVLANNHASVAIIKAAKSLGIPVIHCCRGWGLLCPLKVRLIKPETDELCFNERSFENCSVCAKRKGKLFEYSDKLEHSKQELFYGNQISLKRKLKLLLNCVSPIPIPKLKAMLSLKALKSLIDRYDQYQLILESADRVISLSKMYCSFFDSKKAEAIPTGIDEEFYHPVDETSFLNKLNIIEPYVLVTSRIHHNKGQKWAVEALKYLSTDIKLVLAGKLKNNIHTREIVETIKQLDLEDRVVFTDFLMPKELKQLYSGAIATIVPSIWAEPYGQVTIEAMACACPVIITENSGSAEAVDDGVDGYIVPRKDSKAIACAIKMIQKKRDEFGQKAREKILKKYAWPILSKKIIGIFREVY